MNDIDHHINDTVHVPEEGTHKFRDFWGAYKGHVLGLMRGTLSGGLVGGVVGAGFLGIAALAGLTFAAGPLAIVAAFSVFGIFVGGDIMGRAGYSAGVAAADKAETELRMRYPGSGTGIIKDPNSPPPGEGHHYEVPPERDDGKWFHVQTGIPMTLLGIGVGVLIATAFSGFVAAAVGAKVAAFAWMTKGTAVAAAGVKATVAGTTMHATAAHSLLGPEVAELVAHAGPTILPMLGGGLGFSYGVNRARFKDIFNPIDRWLDGGLIRSRGQTVQQALQIGQQQELTPEAAAGKENSTITTLQRQEESHRLFYDYFERSFWRATRDSIKGSLGGGVVGGGLGAIIGALSFIPPLTPFAPMIMAVTTALGAHEGMKIFTETGMRSGATSAASDLLEVKRQRLQKGLDPEMEMPDGRGKDKNFNFKRAAIGIVIGAVVGMALFAVLGPMIATLTGISVITGGTTAVTSAVAGFLGATSAGTSTLATSLFIGSTVGGLSGAVAGASSRFLKSLAGIADAIYDGRILKGDIRLHQSEPCRLPFLAPSSPWLPRDGEAADKAMKFTTTVVQPIPYQRATLVPQPGDFDGSMREAAPSRNEFMGTVSADPHPGMTGQGKAAQGIVSHTEHATESKRSYPVSAPMGDRIQHLIQEREKTSASAQEREDQRIKSRQAEPAAMLGV